MLRSLIDRIVLTPKPCGKEYAIDLHGDLAGILSLAAGKTNKIGENDPMVQQVRDMNDLEYDESVTMVAGAGFEPMTFSGCAQ